MDKTQEEMLYQSLRLKSWLERVQKQNEGWWETIPNKSLKPLQNNAKGIIAKAKCGKADLGDLFDLFFKTMDEAHYAIDKWQGSWSDAVDRSNCDSEIADCTAQELAIYEKRFGKIPKEEIEKEMYGSDDSTEETVEELFGELEEKE